MTVGDRGASAACETVGAAGMLGWWGAWDRPCVTDSRFALVGGGWHPGGHPAHGLWTRTVGFALAGY